MNDKLARDLKRAVPWAKPLDTSKCECGVVDDLKLIDIRGCNVYGDREVRRKMCCKECRKVIRGLYKIVR